MAKHPLIAIEGIDGSGKKTQSKLLVEEIQSQHRDAVRFEFPNYENVTGPFIDGHLKARWDGRINDPACEQTLDDYMKQTKQLNELLFQCLQTVNRYEQAAALIEALKTKAVILDRYYASGWVYGMVNGVDEKFLRAIHMLLPKPDLYIFIDITVEESYKRRPERRDRYEAQREMQQKVRDGYTNLFKKEGWKIVDGMGTVEEVHERITNCVPTSFIW